MQKYKLLQFQMSIIRDADPIKVLPEISVNKTCFKLFHILQLHCFTLAGIYL